MIIAQGDSNNVPNVELAPGGDYWLTLDLPFNVPTDATSWIFNGLSALGLDVRSIQNPDRQLVIHFRT